MTYDKDSATGLALGAKALVCCGSSGADKLALGYGCELSHCTGLFRWAAHGCQLHSAAATSAATAAAATAAATKAATTS